MAETLGLAKSTVTQHLAVLTEAGFVWKQRLGGQAFYHLDSSGRALLRQLGCEWGSSRWGDFRQCPTRWQKREGASARSPERLNRGAKSTSYLRF
ncbi:ArsR/SmtB family transcription factor [Streptomyces sp. NPDC058067]|uniref:ArsR/SmtB family transcription factor n=1 Tax=Streptomyces sp. NPDC058067 TaxID=3346324 RepID=UPI0036E0216C